MEDAALGALEVRHAWFFSEGLSDTGTVTERGNTWRRSSGLSGRPGQYSIHDVKFTSPLVDGEYAAVVLVDNIVRGQSTAFTVTGCAPETLSVTGSLMLPVLAIGLVMVGPGVALVRRARTNERS